MKLKAIFWVFGATATATGLVLGLRNAARAFGIACDEHYQTVPASRPDANQAHPSIDSEDPFSPDAFRDELLK